AYYAALCATTRPEPADLIRAPSLPIVLEGRLEQAVLAFAATPVSPGVAALAQECPGRILRPGTERRTRLLRRARASARCTQISSLRPANVCAFAAHGTL